MRRVGRLLEQAADPDNLRLAFWMASKGKRQSRQVLDYQESLEQNLFALREQILSGRPEIGSCYRFEIRDPKPRQICAAAFGEQVLHHALMNACHAHFEARQIFDSHASRPGKGLHAAVDRAGTFCRSHAWFLKLDVKKFFASIHHGCLKEQLRRLFKDRRLLELLEAIVDSHEDELGRGVPIGNLSSQYFANHYLAGLDHFVKEQLRCKAYVRYMDDMVLWHDDKAWLKQSHGAIGEFVQAKLQCELKPALLNRTALGVPFLGFRIFPFHVRLLQRSKVRFARKMRLLEQRRRSGEWSETACQRHVLPLVAFTAHADAAKFRRDVLEQMEQERQAECPNEHCGRRNF